MRLRDILPELIPQAGQRWIELARSVPPYDPQQLLAYVSYVERAAEAGNAAAITMLGLLNDMLRALVGAGVNGRIVAKGLIGAAVLPLEPSHWLLLDGLPAEILRCAVNIGHNRIHLPGETAWIDAEWDSGSTCWDLGLPATAIEVIKGVVVSYAAPGAAAAFCQAARLPGSLTRSASPAEPPPPPPPLQSDRPASRAFDDEPWLAKMGDVIAEGKASNVKAAAALFEANVPGASREARIERLCRKFHALRRQQQQLLGLNNPCSK